MLDVAVHWLEFLMPLMWIIRLLTLNIKLQVISKLIIEQIGFK